MHFLSIWQLAKVISFAGIGKRLVFIQLKNHCLIIWCHYSGEKFVGLRSDVIIGETAAIFPLAK